MLKNYLKIALRTVQKHRGFAAINVAGLSLGIAATLLIGLYARNELTYDRFHNNAERTYLVYKERVTPAGTQATYDTWVPLLERMQADFPAIEGGTRVSSEQQWVQHADERFEETVDYVDPDFFEVFTFSLIRGDAANPLPHNNAVVLSQEMAQKYFGEADPIGQTLTIDYQVDYTVTGVMAEVPQNSTLQPNIVVRITSAPDYEEFIDEWGSSFLSTYIVLAEGTAPKALEAQFPAFVKRIWDEEVARRTNVKLLPLPDAYDTFTDSRQYAYILLAIALATILIACINFINLSTARSAERAREIGMRKVLGAMRPQLIGQFLGESMLMGLMGLLLGLTLAELLLPTFNRLYELNLSLDVLSDPLTLLGVLVLGMVLGVFSGFYPALFMTRFEPLTSLQGTFKTSRSGLRMRYTLVVVQFALSIVLIAGTLVMRSQVQYMKTQNLAFDQENVVVLPIELNDFANAEEAAVRLETFKNELIRQPDIVAVTSSSHVPGQWPGWFTFALPEGGDEDKPLRMRRAFADAHYFDTYGIERLEGRPFIEGSEAEGQQSIILNAAAVRDFGWESGEGKIVRLGSRAFTVVGVVQDYHFASLQEAVAPVLHFYRPPENGVHNFISVRIETDDYAATLVTIGTLWQHLDPTRPFDYFFADQNFDQLYQAQDRLVTVASAFALLAILIACLGLFGLASLMVGQRTKEIGVRKVLGASTARITLLLSTDFSKLIAVAFVVGAPIAYFAMEHWLQDFAYRIEISWWIFLIAGLAALGIAFLTVSYQSIKAALANPVDVLRHE